MSDLLRKQIEEFEATQRDFWKDQCTCEDTSRYIGGKYFIIKASTSYEACLPCQEQKTRGKNEQD